MVIDMTKELAPIVFGFIAIMLVSAVSIAFAAFRASYRGRLNRLQSPRLPVRRQPPRGIFVSHRLMHTASSPAH